MKVLSTFRLLNGFSPHPRTRRTSLPLLAGSNPKLSQKDGSSGLPLRGPHSAGGWSCLRPPTRFPRRFAWNVPAFPRIASTYRVVLGGSFRHANHADGCRLRRCNRNLRVSCHRSSLRSRYRVELLFQRIGKPMHSEMSGVSRKFRSRLMTRPLGASSGAVP